MSKKSDKINKLFEYLGEIDTRFYEEALYVDNAEKLKKLKTYEKAKKSHLFQRIITVAACLCFCAGIIFAVVSQYEKVPDTPILPEVSSDNAASDIVTDTNIHTETERQTETEQTDPIHMPITINSIDKLNYYGAMKIFLDSSSFVMKSDNSVTAIKPLSAMRSQAPYRLSLLSDSSESYNDALRYKIDESKVFTITKATFFRIELKNEKGFLASKLGTGVIDVVITKSDIDAMGEMITFKNGERYYSCLMSGSGQDYVEFSTYKYIDGFYIVKSFESENHSFRFTKDSDQITHVTCGYFDSSDTEIDLELDDARVIPYSCWAFKVIYTFTISELESFFNTSKPQAEPKNDETVPNF